MFVKVKNSNMDFASFLEIINKNGIIQDSHISLNKGDILYVDRITDLKIYNCSFEGFDLIIRGNHNQSVIESLTIEKSYAEGLQIIDLEINILKIFDVSVDYIEIIKSNFKNFCIMGLYKINYKIKLHNISVEQKTEILGNKFFDSGSLSIFNSKLKNCDFIESTYNNILIQNCSLLGYFDFYRNKTNTSSNRYLFENCTFEKTNFSETKFSKDTVFNNCDFRETVTFHEASNDNGSSFTFENCLFQKYTQFNYISIWNFEIDTCQFEGVCSFQDTNFHKITIDRVVFDKPIFFDNINIKNIKSVSIRTLRTIKQQLQRADNKIDYNRFRSYELDIYRRELKWNWKQSKDKFILGATWLATGFDHSWRRALLFTLSFGLLFYSLFFISEMHSYTFEISHWKGFISGYFRFLLITDFYNPLIKEREFLTEPLSWLIFILGKIVIAFGIYEMIQAFRKFKA